MPTTTYTDRKKVSDYVSELRKGKTFDQCVRRVTVANATDVTIDPIGMPVIWDDTSDYEFYTNASDISGLVTPPANGLKVGIVVGTDQGFGVNEDTVTVGAAGVELSVLFKDAVVVSEMIDWSVTDVDGVAGVTPAAGAVQTAFLDQLEIQDVQAKTQADTTDPQFTA